MCIILFYINKFILNLKILPKKIDKVELILLEVFLCHDLSL